jgi:hypothetical protein
MEARRFRAQLSILGQLLTPAQLSLKRYAVSWDNLFHTHLMGPLLRTPLLSSGDSVPHVQTLAKNLSYSNTQQQALVDSCFIIKSTVGTGVSIQG